MKFNQWTLGLAAVGAVSLASAVNADEAKVQTALSQTTLSGYVDVAAQYNPGNNNYGAGEYIAPGVNNTKIDNFSLNDVDIALDKPEDDSPWASGYHVEVNYGTDVVGYDTYTVNNQDYGLLRQAYITLRTPVGNGIDWKVGLFDNIIGYEGNTDGANPNYTRSLGYYTEPTTYLGTYGTYKINSVITVQAGVANSYTAVDNAQSTTAKSYLAAISLTAPSSWGWLNGASLNLGVNADFDGNFKGNFNNPNAPIATANWYNGNSVENYYAGLQLPTPISALSFGAAFDYNVYANAYSTINAQDDSEWITGVYSTYKFTDKLSLNLRGEFAKDDEINNQEEEVTATVQYNLWANVLSRAEFRWDHVAHRGSLNDNEFGSEGQNANAYLLALNLIYQF